MATACKATAAARRTNRGIIRLQIPLSARHRGNDNSDTSNTITGHTHARTYTHTHVETNTDSLYVRSLSWVAGKALLASILETEKREGKLGRRGRACGRGSGVLPCGRSLGASLPHRHLRRFPLASRNGGNTHKKKRETGPKGRKTKNLFRLAVRLGGSIVVHAHHAHDAHAYDV